MNLYLISQDVNRAYDTYDAAVVAAESEEEARRIHPHDGQGGLPRTLHDNGMWYYTYSIGDLNRMDRDDTWVPLSDVRATFIGSAAEGTERGVILASFNAG